VGSELYGEVRPFAVSGSGPSIASARPQSSGAGSVGGISRGARRSPCLTRRRIRSNVDRRDASQGGGALDDRASRGIDFHVRRELRGKWGTYGRPRIDGICPDREVLPNESVESSGSALPDAQVELTVTSETDPVRDWAIAVRGGTPSVDGISVPDPVEGDGWFTVTVLGLSATVEMTVALPAGAELTMGHCFDVNEQIEHVALVAPRRLVVEVVQGGLYLCSYQSSAG